MRELKTKDNNDYRSTDTYTMDAEFDAEFEDLYRQGKFDELYRLCRARTKEARHKQNEERYRQYLAAQTG